jgi:hypothetical protein
MPSEKYSLVDHILRRAFPNQDRVPEVAEQIIDLVLSVGSGNKELARLLYEHPVFLALAGRAGYVPVPRDLFDDLADAVKTNRRLRRGLHKALALAERRRTHKEDPDVTSEIKEALRLQAQGRSLPEIAKKQGVELRTLKQRLRRHRHKTT